MGGRGSGGGGGGGGGGGASSGSSSRKSTGVDVTASAKRSGIPFQTSVSKSTLRDFVSPPELSGTGQSRRERLGNMFNSLGRAAHAAPDGARTLRFSVKAPHSKTNSREYQFSARLVGNGSNQRAVIGLTRMRSLRTGERVSRGTS